MKIRKLRSGDEEQLGQVLKKVISKGDTIVWHPQSSQQKLLNLWTAGDVHIYVAELDGELVGSFYIKDNQLDLGNHIANAGFVIDPAHHGKGLGRKMAQHALEEARKLNYLAMQFNFVVKTNTAALRLWQNLGFRVIGEIPNAFRYHDKELVNALIMYREL